MAVLNRILRQTAKIRKGTEAMYFCPCCTKKKRKLEINLVTGKFHCWLCNWGNHSLYALFKKLNAPRDCYKIIGGMKFKKDSSVVTETTFSTHDDLINLLKDMGIPEEYHHMLPQGFSPLYECHTSKDWYNAINYLKNRKFTKYDIIRYNIGYCHSGEFAGRVIIPSYDRNGNLNFYTGRSINDKAWLKYKNCEFSKNIIGFESMINFNLPVTIVEGPTDALTIRYNCVPLFGKTLSEKLKTELICNKSPRVNILLDNDALRDSVDICETLLNNGVNVYLVEMTDKDPSVLGFEKTWEIIDSTKPLTFEGLLKYKLNI